MGESLVYSAYPQNASRAVTFSEIIHTFLDREKVEIAKKKQQLCTLKTGSSRSRTLKLTGRNRPLIRDERYTVEIKMQGFLPCALRVTNTSASSLHSVVVITVDSVSLSLISHFAHQTVLR